MAPLHKFILSAAVLIISAKATSNQDTCSYHVDLSPSTDVTLQQHVTDEDTLTITLSFEGQGWVGVGFNRNGNMIGSTVIIGFPDEPIAQDVNPGRYYLGAKAINQINRVDTRGNRVNVAWSKGESTNQNSEDYEVAVKVDGTDDEDWRRSLYMPQEHHRLLAISDASIEQNETHTTLQFTRPLESSDGYMTKVHRDDLNTLIWAVGSSNQFGYHGSKRGSHTLNFTECSYGSLIDGKGEEEVPVSVTKSESAVSSGSFALGLDASFFYKRIALVSVCAYLFEAVVNF